MKSVLVCLSFLALALPAYSQPYTSGHGALQMFDAQAMAAFPLLGKIWLGIIMVTFATGLFFVRRHTVARVAVIGMIAMMALGEFIFATFGLPLLVGGLAILHLIFWTPALVMLLVQRPFVQPTGGKKFRIWTFVLTIVILISFIFDLRDGWIYLTHVWFL